MNLAISVVQDEDEAATAAAAAAQQATTGARAPRAAPVLGGDLASGIADALASAARRSPASDNPATAAVGLDADVEQRRRRRRREGSEAREGEERKRRRRHHSDRDGRSGSHKSRRGDREGGIISSLHVLCSCAWAGPLDTVKSSASQRTSVPSCCSSLPLTAEAAKVWCLWARLQMLWR